MKRFSSDKDVDKLVRRMVAQGWEYRCGGKHGRLTHPEGRRLVTVPFSPSDRRALQNLEAVIRRRI